MFAFVNLYVSWILERWNIVIPIFFYFISRMTKRCSSGTYFPSYFQRQYVLQFPLSNQLLKVIQDCQRDFSVLFGQDEYYSLNKVHILFYVSLAVPTWKKKVIGNLIYYILVNCTFLTAFLMYIWNLILYLNYYLPQTFVGSSVCFSSKV